MGMMNVPPSPEEVILSRRENEKICLAEASCLGIQKAMMGIYMEDCLNRAEHNE